MSGPFAGETLTIRGAGVLGLAIATELAARGMPLRIVDPAAGPGPQACSWWAGGMLAPWCERESAEEPVLRLGQQAAAWWQKHTGAVTFAGTLVLAQGRDTRELDRFGRLCHGGFRSVDGAEIAGLEPDLEGRFSRGLFFDAEAHLAPRVALEALKAGLAAKGIEILREAPVEGPEIDTRGLAARDSLPDLRGVRGEMLVIRCPEVSLARPVRMLHPRIPLYIVPRGDGVFMLGATMIESDRRGQVTARAMLELLGAAYALHPAFAEAEVLELGADARPAFPDNLPRLRRRGRTIYANGLYRHGFLLSAPVAVMLADYLQTGARPEFMDEDHA